MRAVILILLTWISSLSAQASFGLYGGGPIDSVVARWIAAGYWEARYDPHLSTLPARGSLYRLRGIDIRDERGLSPEGFSLAEFTGDAASRRNLEAVQAAAREHYLNSGFPFVEIVARARPDTAADVVDLELKVTRGSSFKRGEARVLETRTQPETVRRLALWKTDEDFSRERTEKGLQRLRRTGYFEAVEWTGLYRDPDRNLLYPVLRLPDAPANTVGGLLGFDSKAEDGGKLTGYLDIHLVNLFGTARDFDFSFDDRSGFEREIRASYTEPWLFALPLGARVEGSFLQQDTLFWEWSQGLTFFRDLSFISRLEVEFGAQANRENGLDGNPGSGSQALRSGVRLLFDARDRALFTRSGYRSSLGATGVRRTFDDAAGDSAYFLVQAQASLENWIPLSPRFGLRLSGRAASNFPLNRLNHGELYYVGGARSLRGYREREFQTNAYALTEGELQYWVGRRGSLFAFVSPGMVNRLSDAGKGRYDGRGVLGYGFGIELAQGDWSLSLAYALNPERRPGDGLLHVAVENRF
jgi:outer membrane protein assembly factor BamA